MNKLLTITALTALALGQTPCSLKAQSLSSELQYLDINQIKAANMVHGDMWYHLADYSAGFEFPKGSEKHASYMGGLWLAARDAKDSLYTAATGFRASGVDFFPGPLNDTGFCTATVSANWARIWKVNVSEIIAFKALSSRTTATVPASILEWPAKGNIYAKGASGVILSVPGDMAPFVDADGDGIYNALNGDFPKIKGDQMLWWVINDNTATHYLSRGKPLRVECRISAYAYSRGTSADRMLFYEFDMINKSANSYTSFRPGLYSDLDIGHPSDDYMQFDSARRTALTFNGNIPDAPNGKNSYGYHPPLVGYAMVETPGDVYPSALVPAASFNTFYGLATGNFRDPRAAIEFERYLKAQDADGSPIPGYPYILSRPGSMLCDVKGVMGDRRFVMAGGATPFAAGAKLKFSVAAFVTDTLGIDGCTTGCADLKSLSDSAWTVYWNPLKSLGVTELSAQDAQLRVFPNPAQNFVLLQSMTGRKLQAAHLQVYDMQGRKINVAVLQESDGLRIGLDGIASGAYHLIYEDADRRATASFVKQ
jgi:hypothetical protein